MKPTPTNDWPTQPADVPTTPLAEPWQELAVRLQDPVQGVAELDRTRAQIQRLQSQLNQQAHSGLASECFSRLNASRQAVDAALRILHALSAEQLVRPPSSDDGPAHSRFFLKGETP